MAERVLIVRGDLNSYSGYTQAILYYLSWLEQRFTVVLGVDLHRHDNRFVELWKYPTIKDSEIPRIISAASDASVTVLTVSTPDNFRRFKGAESVGLFFWETDRLGRPAWIDRINKLDAVWVPVKFMAKMLVEEGVRVPVMHWPCPVSLTEETVKRIRTSDVPRVVFRPLRLDYDTKASPTSFQAIRSDSEHVFLSTNTVLPRKGFAVLAAEWLSVLAKYPSASLVLKVGTIDVTETETALFERLEETFRLCARRIGFQGDLRVYARSQRLEEDTLLSLVRHSDAFVSCSFGEGFGISVFQSLALGKPALCPRHTAFAELLPQDYAYFLDTDVVNVGLGDPVGVLPISARWGVPREGSLVRAVDRLVKDLETQRQGAAVAHAQQAFAAANISAPHAVST